MRALLARRLRSRLRRRRRDPRRRRASAPSSGPPATRPRRACAPTAWPRSCAAAEPGPLPLPGRRLRDRHREGVPALVPPALRAPRAHHRARPSATTSGTTASRATTATGTAARASGCRPGSRPDRRLGDPQPELAGAARSRIRLRCAGSSRPLDGAGRLPHRVLAPSALQRGRLRRRAGPEPALEPARRATRRSSSRGHDHNLQRHRPQRGLTQYVVGAGGRGALQPAPRQPDAWPGAATTWTAPCAWSSGRGTRCSSSAPRTAACSTAAARRCSPG